MRIRKLFVIVSALLMAACADSSYKQIENPQKDFSKLETSIGQDYGTASSSLGAAESVIAEILGTPKPAAQIDWHDFSMPYIVQALDSGSYVFMYFYTEGCDACTKTEQDIFVNAGIIKKLDEYYAIRTDIMKHPDLQRIFTKDGSIITPTFVFMWPTGAALVVQGYIPIEKFVYILDAVTGDAKPWISAKH